jgi:hypothetical protein
MPAVSLSAFGGVGAQFFDNSGVILTGGKIYTYAAGTTTPAATYTSNTGNTAHTNPIILDSAGRVPGGEIWLQVGAGYKFVVKTSAEVLIATYDNIPSAPQPPAANDADSIMYEQGYTVTAGSFVAGQSYRIASIGTTNFTLIGATSNTVGLHFIATGSGTGDGTAEVSQTVETKLRQYVSVIDFGADPTGAVNSATAFTNAIATGKLVLVPKGTYLRGATTTTYATDQYLGILRVGNLTTTNSSDPQVIVARDVDNSESGNGHCFSDSSNINRLGGISYNSYDGRITLTGSYNYGHYAAFQAGPVFAGSGVIDDYFPFVCGLSISSGTLTNYYGLILQAPVITGTGAVTNSYGVFIPRTYGPPFSGVTTLNFAWYNDSASKSYNYGQVQADGGMVAGKNNAGAGTNHVNVKNIDAISANGTEAGIRLQQVGFNTWDWIIPASQTYCSIVANNVERFRMLNAGSFLPAADGTQPLGGASNRWSEVFAASGTINTSDEREKQDVAALDAAELRVAVALKGLVKKYRFKDAVKSKRDAARIHVGVIAQKVVAAFAAEGLDANSYALLCYDEWEAEVDADGVEVKAAGSRYGIRYEELLAFIIAAL